MRAIVLAQSLEDIRRAYGLGANAYIVKPQEPDDLIHVVELVQKRWLNIEGATGQASEPINLNVFAQS